MDYLVDTHAVIWSISSSDKLPRSLNHLLKNTTNNYFISIASYWEIAIKFSAVRLDLDLSLVDFFSAVEEFGFKPLPIKMSHVMIVATLPFHHRDPFDRIIIAQAMEENMTLVSKDSEFSKYEIPILWN